MSLDEKIKQSFGCIDLAESMLTEHTEEYLIVYTGPDGKYYMSASNLTWGLGALHRARLDLEASARSVDIKPEEDIDG
jgi:hypothetical protein